MTNNDIIKKSITVGSVCSGIEAASVAWSNLNFDIKWFSEISDFPSKLLKVKYPEIPNYGDMTLLPEKILKKQIFAPDLICGGTPCQAFSLAGWRSGLEDPRGNLTLSFVDIVEENDFIREQCNLSRTIVFWENVEGVLKDSTNAFGSFVSSLAGLDDVIQMKKWPDSGLIRGKTRNVAWRVLDAKFFGIPQQRKRVYVLAGGKDFFPEDILFEVHNSNEENFNSYSLKFRKKNINFEVFREYTDVLYSAYGTKWNGNAAAYNGSLFISQENRLRRFSPLECERLMGFPDNYTNIKGAKRTQRYQALGNSWAVPVINWIGRRILSSENSISNLIEQTTDNEIFLVSKFSYLKGIQINCSSKPEYVIQSNLLNIIETEPPKQIYISPVGCAGILRRKNERNLKMNPNLEKLLTKIASELPMNEIEKISNIQKRGALSNKKQIQLSLFD